MANMVTDVVAERLKKEGIVLATEKAISALVERTVAKQADAIVKVIDLIDQEKRNLNKINRPDIIALNAEGKTSREEYTPARMQEINKAKQKITKLENALAKALEKDDFGDLYNAASGKLADDKGGSETES